MPPIVLDKFAADGSALLEWMIVLDDRIRAARRCDRAARQFEGDEARGIRERLAKAIGPVARFWSRSWIGYQSRVYIRDLRPRQPGESFDTEWGAEGGFSDTTCGEWAEYDGDVVSIAVDVLALGTGGLRRVSSCSLKRWGSGTGAGPIQNNHRRNRLAGEVRPLGALSEHWQ